MSCFDDSKGKKISQFIFLVFIEFGALTQSDSAHLDMGQVGCVTIDSPEVSGWKDLVISQGVDFRRSQEVFKNLKRITGNEESEKDLEHTQAHSQRNRYVNQPCPPIFWDHTVIEVLGGQTVSQERVSGEKLPIPLLNFSS